MYISLNTHDVWRIDGSFHPARFFSSLSGLLMPGDIIAVGAYEPSSTTLAALVRLHATQNDISKIYFGSFEYNLIEHPHGRSFEIEVTDEALIALETLCGHPDGQNDKALFFDHVVAYRRGCPTLPLFCYHDAFNGGSLYLSGLFDKGIIQIFSKKLGASHSTEFNPEFQKTD